jgi:pSer/pThr/pTyr-binding forkhead associated (FHA) protein
VKAGEEIFIGKDPSCEIQLSDMKFVNNKHASISLKNGEVLIRDLGSRNG